MGEYRAPTPEQNILNPEGQRFNLAGLSSEYEIIAPSIIGGQDFGDSQRRWQTYNLTLSADRKVYRRSLSGDWQLENPQLREIRVSARELNQASDQLEFNLSVQLGPSSEGGGLNADDTHNLTYIEGTVITQSLGEVKVVFDIADGEARLQIFDRNFNDYLLKSSLQKVEKNLSDEQKTLSDKQVWQVLGCVNEVITDMVKPTIKGLQAALPTDESP